MSYKCIIVLACCIALAVANPVDLVIDDNVDLYELNTPILHRQARSPQGNIDLTYKKDQFGREAGLQYNQNLYKSDNGRFNVDAYAQASRNFDYNRNNYGGGIVGSWRF
ncbi:uncharacterized protein LOC119672938 [Teleopsis dalmanni]|uniref:uncharacterized protein LOC119670430 n=1 Tax=Teleopsis dalmanni TaxID=139649 RepID=UPI0018CF6AD9|nr:uncharacterized protein LOC119670430 [Teleopsis dalmanni]XP_037940039.1 uncharacterized protein LOC119672938 [Teleopsis dalmanni]